MINIACTQMIEYILYKSKNYNISKYHQWLLIDFKLLNSPVSYVDFDKKWNVCLVHNMSITFWELQVEPL